MWRFHCTKITRPLSSKFLSMQVPTSPIYIHNGIWYDLAHCRERSPIKQFHLSLECESILTQWTESNSKGREIERERLLRRFILSSPTFITNSNHSRVECWHKFNKVVYLTRDWVLDKNWQWTSNLNNKDFMVCQSNLSFKLIK